MMTNEQIRRELSFGIGEPQNISDMTFTVTRREEPELQSWDRIVLELIEWPRDEL